MIYLANNDELSQRNPGGFAFKIGWTDRSLAKRKSELNGESDEFPEIGKYGGGVLDGESRWFIRKACTLEGNKVLEGKVVADVLAREGSKLEGYFTSVAGKKRKCKELFVVKLPFAGTYFSVDWKARIDFHGIRRRPGLKRRKSRIAYNGSQS